MGNSGSFLIERIVFFPWKLFHVKRRIASPVYSIHTCYSNINDSLLFSQKHFLGWGYSRIDKVTMANFYESSLYFSIAISANG